MTAIWYPGCTVRFGVRFEDFLPSDPSEEQSRPSDQPISDPRPYEGPESAQEPPRADVTAIRGVGEFKNLGFDVVPYNCSVELNSYREADRVRLTLPLQQFPFDPRIIRAATVKIFGGVHRPDDWAQLVGSNTAIMLGPTTNLPTGQVSNELFRGFVDDWEITIDGHDVIQVTARDLTGWLLDAELVVNPLDDIPHTTPLDEVVRLIITGDGSGLPPALEPKDAGNKRARTPGVSRRWGLDGMRGLRVVNEATDVDPGTGIREPMPTLAEFLPPNWFDSKKTTKKGRKRAGKAQKQSYWDTITDLCVAAGFICYIRQSRGEAAQVPGLGAVRVPELVISSPRIYYKPSARTGPVSTLPDGSTPEVVQSSQVRRYLYGLNVDSLRIRRKLTGINVPAGVEARSHDVTQGIQVVGRFPATPKNHAPAPSGAGSRIEYKVFHGPAVSGPRAQAIVDAVARSIYEQLGRGEMEIRIETKHLAALQENLDLAAESGQVFVPPDLFQLRPADPVEIGIAPQKKEVGAVSSFQDFTDRGEPAIVERLRALNFPDVVAQQVARALADPAIQREFRCRRSILNWDHTSGWSANIDAINYLDVRDAVEAASGEPLSPRDFTGPETAVQR